LPWWVAYKSTLTAKRFKQQEKERAEREKAVREGRERQKLEAELALDLQSGFHYDH
jgi:hypothetical protein